MARRKLAHHGRRRFGKTLGFRVDALFTREDMSPAKTRQLVKAIGPSEDYFDEGGPETSWSQISWWFKRSETARVKKARTILAKEAKSVIVRDLEKERAAVLNELISHADGFNRKPLSTQAAWRAYYAIAREDRFQRFGTRLRHRRTRRNSKKGKK